MHRDASTPLRADVTVVGAGAAGLFSALVAAGEGARVTLVSRSELAASASYWAQGGIAAALAAEDSPERHAKDTLIAGRRAARPSAVRMLCEESPERVRELQAMGLRFDADRHGALALGLEGGHSVRRVVHAGGAATGRRITRELSALAAAHERIDVLEETTASALLVRDGRCVGVAISGRGARAEVLSRATVLATGGAAALWARTTNPAGAVGAGLALAHAAGAALADLELVQFHPTALAVSGACDGFLVTEAVRGEGATLHDSAGAPFVDELAPRDEVALAIEAELRRSGGAAVSLDLRAIDMARFPNIAEVLGEVGIDPARDTVPVAPAAHYTMGGVATDLHGRASLAGLLAVGECACTGLHGANRLASNSLAECLVVGRRAALAAIHEPAAAAIAAIAEPPTLAAANAEPPTLAAATAEPPTAATAGPAVTAPGAAVAPPLLRPPSAGTRAALWRHAGLRRDAEGLGALARDPYPLARLIASAALAREESRGAHQRRDFRATDDALDGTHAVVDSDERVTLERWE